MEIKSNNAWLLCSSALVSLMLAFPVHSEAAGLGHGYAWANEPTKTQYTPNGSYSFNSKGGAITINRTKKGVYSVTFKGLGGGGSAGGHVQVSSYGTGNQYCKASNWSSGGAHFKIGVRCFAAAGLPADTQFLVHASWPQKAEVVRPVAPVLPVTSKTEISREIAPTGNVKINYADGSSKLVSRGGFTITNPDGVSQTYLFSTQALAATPPLPPEGSDESVWLTQQAHGLLGTISALVENNQESIDNYLEAEGNVGVYDQIAKRRVTLDFLVNP